MLQDLVLFKKQSHTLDIIMTHCYTHVERLSLTETPAGMFMKAFKQASVFCALLAVSMVPHTNAAYPVVIAGVTLACQNSHGRPVDFLFDPSLNDVGKAYPLANPPLAVLNPVVLSQLTPAMQVFWWAHECAHHTVGADEMAADCYAIKTMRNIGLLPPGMVPQLMAQIFQTPGSPWGHLPGPLRAQHFMNCYNAP